MNTKALGAGSPAQGWCLFACHLPSGWQKLDQGLLGIKNNPTKGKKRDQAKSLFFFFLFSFPSVCDQPSVLGCVVQAGKKRTCPGQGCKESYQYIHCDSLWLHGLSLPAAGRGLPLLT